MLLTVVRNWRVKLAKVMTELATPIALAGSIVTVKKRQGQSWLKGGLDIGSWPPTKSEISLASYCCAPLWSPAPTDINHFLRSSRSSMYSQELVNQCGLSRCMQFGMELAGCE